ncbi:maleylpyruvate isomerase family mycothiol-dependent enzyme [Allokutzneria multivorans]|uniref:Maleylpyruvate isomerase family mycothiol-dependent enzyme n=2 Tax=Allokutzneria multivorans TaxID=1142134 RepID=A0ABP7R7S2_9PSEU
MPPSSFLRMGIDYIATTVEQTAAFTAAVSAPGALTRRVPSCPEWTVADLVAHLGEVQTWWEHGLRSAGLVPDEAVVAELAEPGADLLAWWRSRSASFLGTLRATPPDSASWCWWSDNKLTSAAEVAERQAHEVLIHRWDAENALGAAAPLDPALAADGVREFLQRFLWGKPWSGPEGLVRLRASDTGDEWDVALRSAQPRRVPVYPEVPASAVVNGTAEQLDLVLWRRIPLTALAVEGEVELVDALVSWTSLD